MKKLGIQELKTRYKLLVANNKTIDSQEMFPNIPLSTGSPVLDSFILEKVKSTFSMDEYEHLARSWQLIRNMSDEEEKIILNNLKGLLNDHKILLAAKLFENKDKNFEKAFDSLPNTWKLKFPLVFVKPAKVFFDGWKANIKFRLFEKIDYSRLNELYSETLKNCSDSAILKYRKMIHETSSLIGYKWNTKREKSIEDWCYKNGNNSSELPLVELYVKARDTLNSHGKDKFIKDLSSSTQKLPITSFMGLLSAKDLVLYSKGNEKLQDYAVECSSGVESILKLREWSKWLNEGHVNTISKKLNSTKEMSVPFSRVTIGYLSIEPEKRKLLTDQIYIPLLKKFGKEHAYLLPEKFNFVQPANLIHIENFLLFNMFNSASKGKMTLVGENEDYEFSFSIDEIKNVVNLPLRETQDFLLKNFGGLTSSHVHNYSDKRITESLRKIDKGELLILNTPFFRSINMINELMSWNKVINLTTYFGCPTEISLKYSLENFVKVENVKAYRVSANNAAYNTTEYLEKLYWFEKIGGELYD